jgi:hypothetical protein
LTKDIATLTASVVSLNSQRSRVVETLQLMVTVDQRRGTVIRELELMRP